MPTAFSYDELSDTLYVSFVPGQAATGIELNDHILLRVTKEEGQLHRFNHLVLLERSVIPKGNWRNNGNCL